MAEAQGATFSLDRKYRYRLWRQWGDGAPLAFIMLNPSTADEIKNDPTVERCERRARMLGRGGLIVCNIFALRATDPKQLRLADDPIGPENDAYLLNLINEKVSIVCGWGSHGRHVGRGATVKEMLSTAGASLFVLKLNQDGEPVHPLYQPYVLRPIPWDITRQK